MLAYTIALSTLLMAGGASIDLQQRSIQSTTNDAKSINNKQGNGGLNLSSKSHLVNKDHDEQIMLLELERRSLQTLPTRPPIIQRPPINDDCTSATLVSTLPYSSQGTTVASTADFDTTSCGAYADANGVWYTYTPTQTKSITATVDSGQNLRIYSGNCDSNSNNDNLSCLAGFDPTRDFVGEAGKTYKFLVSKQTYSPGSTFTITIRDYDVPPNDTCVNSIAINNNELPYLTRGTTLGALPDFGYANSCGAYVSANGVWYNYIPSMTKIIQATITTGMQRLRVYSSGTSGDCNNLLCEEEYSADTTRSFVGNAGTQYQFLISSQTYNIGETFTLSVTDYKVPMNNDCDTATIIPSLPYVSRGSTLGALPDDFDSASCGAYDDANGVWYRYVVPDDEALSVTVSVDLEQRVRVYSGGHTDAGGCDEDLTCIGNQGSSTSTITFEAMPNIEYRFLVSKQTFDVGGPFTIQVSGEAIETSTSAPTVVTPFPTAPLPTVSTSISPQPSSSSISSQSPSFMPSSSSKPSLSTQPSTSVSPSSSVAPSVMPTISPIITAKPTTLAPITANPTTSKPSSFPTSAPTRKATDEPIQLIQSPPPTTSPSQKPKPMTAKPTMDEVGTTMPPTNNEVPITTLKPSSVLSAPPEIVTASPTVYSSTPPTIIINDDEDDDDCINDGPTTLKSKAAKLFKSNKQQETTSSLSMSIETSKSNKSVKKCKSSKSTSSKGEIKGKASKAKSSSKATKMGKASKKKNGIDNDSSSYNRLSQVDRIGLIQNNNASAGRGDCSLLYWFTSSAVMMMGLMMIWR